MSENLVRRQQLETAVSGIQRRYGCLALVHGKPPAGIGHDGVFPHIPTGFPQLDEASGIGGLAKGRVTELIGPATSGKTTLALQFLAAAQANGSQVGYLDQACFFDPDYAHQCGVDLARLLVIAPHDWREALAMAEALVGSGGLSALVFDGLDALWSDADAAPPIAACLNRLAAPLARSGTALVFLHTPATGGSPALSALAHHATLRLGVTRELWLRRSGDVQGYQARVEVLKNRLGPAGRVVALTIVCIGTVHGQGL
jgi:recombination protein RecA